MEQYIACRNKDRKDCLLFLTISLVILGIGIYLLSNYPKGHINFIAILLTTTSAIFGFLLFIGFLTTLNSKKYFPQYKVGDVLIISEVIGGSRRYKFSQYDDIIENIPKYTVKEIGKCSYLLAPKDHDGESREIEFTSYDGLFSIEEFKKRAECC